MELIKSANGFYVLHDGNVSVVCKDLTEVVKELELAFEVPLPPIKDDEDKAEVKDSDDNHWDSDPTEGLDL